VRAATHGRSTEAEIRAILESAVRPEGRIKLGTLLADIGREVGGIDLEIERDRTSVEPMRFE
jgi:plasmid stability protein